MFDRMEQEAYIRTIDQHIEELQQRIGAISQLITDMQNCGEKTESQVELLATMCAVMGGLHTIRLETLQTLKVNDFRIHRGLTQ